DGDGRCGAGAGGARPRRRATPRADRRGDDQRRAVHGGDARPGPADPHRQRDARQQLPVVADLLRRAVGDGQVLAGLRRRDSASGAGRLWPQGAPLRRAEVKTRIWMGLVMAVLAAGVLAADGWLAAQIGRPFYPCLFVATLLLSVLVCVELRALLKG